MSCGILGHGVVDGNRWLSSGANNPSRADCVVWRPTLTRPAPSPPSGPTSPVDAYTDRPLRTDRDELMIF
jgi:hypothetical protein